MQKNTNIVVRKLGLMDYKHVWQSMQSFTNTRLADTPDEIWLVEHPPVFTQGQAGKQEHLLSPGEIPVIHVDRGGQVTYHGPGQQMLYLMIDLERRKLGVRELVNIVENAVIGVMADYDVCAIARRDAPGVYVDNKKVASLGLRIRNGCSYHGLALNVDMDLSPFSRINPCGYKDLEMTQTSTLCELKNIHQAGEKLVKHFLRLLKTDDVCFTEELPGHIN